MPVQEEDVRLMVTFLKTLGAAVGVTGLIAIVAIAVNHYDATRPTPAATALPSLALQCYWTQVHPDPDTKVVLYRQPMSDLTARFVTISGYYNMRFVKPQSVDMCVLHDDTDAPAYDVVLTFGYFLQSASSRQGVAYKQFSYADIIVPRVEPRSRFLMLFINDFPGENMWLVPTTRCTTGIAGNARAKVDCHLPRVNLNTSSDFVQLPDVLFHYRSASDCWGLNPVAPKFQVECQK